MILDKKWRQPQIILSFLMITFSCVTKNVEAARDRGARCEKPDYIPNGSYRIRRDRLMRITCNTGFILQGPKTIDCIRGKWDGEKPVCAKKGCKKDLEQPENGRIQIESDMKAILYCSDNYNLAGNRHSYCNGSHWDRPIGNCRERKNVVQHQCDFETDDICGWTYEPREGLEWKRVMAANVFTTFKTGPRHDHTTLTANGGHYMLMESLTRQNDFVTLTSPIYDRGLSLKTACCFQFYYFMYGAGVGDLFVAIKPVSLDLEDLLKNHKDLIKFQKYGNQNNIWNEAHFNIEELDEDFQILFVAKSGRGQLSDIAVDDVKLLTGDDCRALDSKDDEYISNEEYDVTTYESIFEMQSCAGRCFESPGNGIVRIFGHLKGLCNCDTECEDNETCCPDFRSACLNDVFAQSTPLSEDGQTTYKNYERQNHTITSQATTTTTANIRFTTTTTSKATTTKITPTNTTVKQTTVRTIPTTNKTISIASTLATPNPSKATATETSTARLTTPTTTSNKNAFPFIPTRKTTSTTTTKTTSTTTTTKTTPITRTPKTTSTTRTPKTTPTTTTRKTTPLATTMIKSTPTTSTTTSKPTPKTNPAKTTSTTTKTTTTRATSKLTTRTTQKTTNTSVKTVIFTKPTYSSTVTRGSKDATFTRSPVPASEPIEYIMKEKSKTHGESKGSSRLLLYTFFIIVIFILACATYKRFGDKAVSWYMIRFKQNTSGDEDSSSVVTSFKRPQAKASDIERNSKTHWRHKIKSSTNIKNIMKIPLVNENDEGEDGDDDIGASGNIALKNNIYTEL